jgi:hypothetical protein
VVREVLVLGCQGLGIVWVLWANIMQIIMGYRMSVALRRYEDWVSLSIRKVQVPFLLLSFVFFFGSAQDSTWLDPCF